jgi:hypothetical protein
VYTLSNLLKGGCQMRKTRSSRRWILIPLVAATVVWLASPAYSYVRRNCFGGDLYIDFYDDSTGTYQGYIRVPGSSACTPAV